MLIACPCCHETFEAPEDAPEDVCLAPDGLMRRMILVDCAACGVRIEHFPEEA